MNRPVAARFWTAPVLWRFPSVADVESGNGLSQSKTLRVCGVLGFDARCRTRLALSFRSGNDFVKRFSDSELPNLGNGSCFCSKS